MQLQRPVKAKKFKDTKSLVENGSEEKICICMWYKELRQWLKLKIENKR